MSGCPLSPTLKESLPLLTARRIVDWFFPVSSAACFRPMSAIAPPGTACLPLLAASQRASIALQEADSQAEWADAEATLNHPTA
jgi:hypothetical protein